MEQASQTRPTNSPSDAVWDEHQKVLDRIELERLLGRRLSPPQPHVRKL